MGGDSDKPWSSATCLMVIPGTFIACGEGGNFCSDECARLGATPPAPLDEPMGPPPKTRADCESGERPCPWRTCRHHFDGPTESCALDVADRGEHSQVEIAELMGLSRQRIQQLEVMALEKVHAALKLEGSPRKLTREESFGRLQPKAVAVDAVEPEPDGEPVEVDEGDAAEVMRDRVWRAYVRGSVLHGFVTQRQAWKLLADASNPIILARERGDGAEAGVAQGSAQVGAVDTRNHVSPPRAKEQAEFSRRVAGSSPAPSLGTTTEPSHIVSDSSDAATNEEEQDAGEAT